MTGASVQSHYLVPLVEELLDAQLDTVELALELKLSREWLNHLEYLGALHREAEAMLARLPAGSARVGSPGGHV